MMGLTYEDVIERIKESGYSAEEIEEKIRGKLNQLSDLISREGAAHIVANELGIKLFENFILKINRVQAGMSSINLIGKVVKLYDVKEFKTEKRSGKVANFSFGDDTGIIRVVFWDEKMIKLIEAGQIKDGDILKLKNGYGRDNNGFKEVHFGSKGEIEINPENVEVEVIDKPALGFTKKKLNELKEGENNVGVFGTIVQVFEPRFYDSCPECGKKVEVEGDKFKCIMHGYVSPKPIPILNLFFDDGTDNIRVVAFRNQAEELLGKTYSQILELKDNAGKFEDAKAEILGKQIVIVGRVVKNIMFDRLELNCQRILDMEPSKVIEELVR